MTDFQDHGVTLEGAAEIHVYRDDWIPSRPWFADVVWADGQIWRGWQQFFWTRKALVQNAQSALDAAGMSDAKIVFK